MIKDRNFRFDVSLSLEKFQNKEISNSMIGSSRVEKNRRTRKEYGYNPNRGVSFMEQNVSPSELLDKLLNGHVFCHCFDPLLRRKDNSFSSCQKTHEYFKHSYCIGVDIDFTNYSTIQDYIDKLTLKPTFWYSSYNHMKPDKKGYVGCKFRMIYVFDLPIENVYWFRFISHSLIEIIERDTQEKVEDKCSESPSQYFNGTNIKTTESVEYGCTDFIYELEDVIENPNPNSPEFIDYLKNFCGYTVRTAEHRKKIKELLERITGDDYTYNSKTRSFEKDEVYEKDVLDLIDDFEICMEVPDDYETEDMREILWFWDNRTIDEFKKIRKWNIWRENFKYIYRKEKVKWEKDYQIVGDDYFSLPFYPVKLIDGQHRRKILYQRCCLRKYMYPTIDKSELIYNYIVDVIRFVDDPERDITGEVILKNVVSCLQQSVDDIENKYGKLIERYKTLTRPKRNLIFKDRSKHTRETTFKIIDEFYNESFTVGENHVMMEHLLPFPISLNYLTQYTRERKIKTDPHKLTDEELYDLIQPDLSIEKNLKLIKGKGFKCKKDRLSKIIKEKRQGISKVKSLEKTERLEGKKVDWFLYLLTTPDDSIEEQERFEREKERMNTLSFDEMLDEIINLRDCIRV